MKTPEVGRVVSDASALRLLVPVGVFAGVALASACASAPPEPSAPDGVTIQRVITDVQHGLAAAQRKLKDSLAEYPPLKTVTLTLITEASVTDDYGVKLFVVSFTDKWQSEEAQKLILTLTPPPPSGTGMLSVGDKLSEAIVQAVTGVQEARNSTPPLNLKTLTADISFVVSRVSSGGAEIEFELLPVSGNMGTELKSKATQKITVVFEEPKKAAESGSTTGG